MLPIALMFTGGLKLPSITCTYIPTQKSGVDTLRELPQEADPHRASKFFGFSVLGSYFLVLWFLFIRSFGFGLMALTHLSVIVVAPHMSHVLHVEQWQFFEMAAMPFPCNGILVVVGNLPRLLKDCFENFNLLGKF